MPWSELTPIEHRLLFIADHLRQADSISALCKRHGISRKRPATSGSSATPTRASKGWWIAAAAGMPTSESLIRSGKRSWSCACKAAWSKGRRRSKLAPTKSVFERLFRRYGLPDRLRTDNGVPFASTGCGGLSQLSIWWLKLGIVPERIAPGHPEQNGRRERVHRTLKRATGTRPPGRNGAVEPSTAPNRSHHPRPISNSPSKTPTPQNRRTQKKGWPAGPAFHQE